MGSDELPIEPPRYLRFFISGLDGSSSRPVLLLGFGAVFALWLFSSYDLVRRVAEAEAQAAALTTRFTEDEELLFTVRAQVFLSSVYARDAVLDTGPEAVSFHREQLRRTRGEVEQALERYLPHVDSPIEREHWTRLQSELQDYWTRLSPVMRGQVPGNPADVQAFFRRDVIPKRELIVRISDDIRTLNQDALQQQQVEVAQLHSRVRQRIWWTGGIAAVLGLGIAWLAAGHAGRLESRIREQHLRERQQKRDLQRLSGELVHAQEDERRTIGRDLHDEIGQALMTIKLDLGVVERGGQLSAAAADALGEARSTTDVAIQSVRDLSQLLHPAMLDDFGLAVTLDSYVRKFSERTGVRTELVVDRMEERMASELEICAYRVVQEAMTNVAKHARATSSRVYLQRLPYSLLVTVEDDGTGFDPARIEGADARRGVGLVGVRERVSRLGGTVRMESHVGKGSRLTIELPVPVGERSTREATSLTASPAAAQERG